MRVVEKKSWSYKFTCSCCESQLEAEADDVVYRDVFDSDGDRVIEGSSYYVVCPECGESEDIPGTLGKKIADAARSRYDERNKPTT